MLVEVVLLILLLVLLKKVLQKPEGLPPGRWGLPLVGYIPFTRRSMEDQVLDLHKEHGDLFIWRMGTQLVVFLADYHMAKEAFLKSEFTDRPDWVFFTVKENPPLGVAAPNGVHWHNNRRFSMRQLRDLGMGKSKLVNAIHTQAKWLVEELKKQADKSAPVPHALHVAIVNIIWQMVGSRQFGIDAPELKEFNDLIDEFVNSFTRIAILDFIPWIENILPTTLTRWIFKHDLVDRIKGKFVMYFKKMIDENRETLDRDNPRDLIDGYLMEMEEKKDEPSSTLSERDLAFLILDLFTAGSQTSRDTMIFLFYYLAVNPKAQTKLQAEIDQVLGDAPPSLEDRSRMPYTDAVINEVMRMSSLAATGLQHMASADMHVGGYFIPKGSVMQTTVVSMHYDPRYWDNPQQFLPERWLDTEGHFNTKKDGFMPFGVGKRQCLGESLARMELFIFTTTIFQQLTFTSPPGKTVNPSYDPSVPVLHAPIKQDVLVTVRK